MSSNQFCSVCKQWLDMEVVSSGDAEEDDGVTWYRCPGCQGFLPKLTSREEDQADQLEPASPASVDPLQDAALPSPQPPDRDALQAMPWNSPGEMQDEADATSQAAVSETLADMEDDWSTKDKETPEDEAWSDDSEPAKSPAPTEPIGEYAAMLAEVDPEQAVPYRPWISYTVGQCILHLAWNDCGVVVAKESLPGGRQVIKCFFSQVGVVRLIENAPQ